MSDPKSRPINDIQQNLKRLPEVAGLKKGEVGFLITIIAEYDGQVALVKDEYQSLFEKDISANTIQQIKAKYSDQITSLAKSFRDDIMTCPLAKRGFRVRALWRLAKEAMIIKFREAKKVGIDDYREINDCDYRLAYACIMAAEKIMADSERFEWQKEVANRQLVIKEHELGINKVVTPAKITPEEQKSLAQDEADELEDGFDN